MRASISVCWNAWPMCSVPVTLGGGSWMQYAGFLSSCWRKYPAASHRWYQACSMAAGLKLLSSTSALLLAAQRLGHGRGHGFAHDLHHADRELGADPVQRARRRPVDFRPEALEQAALQLIGERIQGIFVHVRRRRRRSGRGGRRLCSQVLHDLGEDRDVAVGGLGGAHSASFARSWLVIL